MADFERYYVEPDYWVDGYTFDSVPVNIPDWAVLPVEAILKSYLYQEYKPDDNAESFFIAYNNIAQSYLTYLINLNLPIWTAPSIAGNLLDWVAKSLYGFDRPVLTTSGIILGAGEYNTVAYNEVAVYNEAVITSGNTTSLVNDDIFKRCLTWNLYKADGFQFNVRWLKNRVRRFVSGANGEPVHVYDTNNISVTYSSGNNIIITVDTSAVETNGVITLAIATILQEAIDSEVLQLPFQYNFSVVII